MANIATSTTTGARSTNEDFEFAQDLEHYALVLILDGHDGKGFKDKFGPVFSERLLEVFREASPDLDLEECVNIVKSILKEILGMFDQNHPNLEGGCTLSLGLVQKTTRRLYTFQIGDSMVFMANSISGSIENGCKIFSNDDADSEKYIELGYQPCLTVIHDFNNPNEASLYKKLCETNPRNFTITPRTDACALEKRVLGKIGFTHLPEPSRTLESDSWYRKNRLEFVKDIQRTPEISVWEFQSLDGLALCAVCDGFVSKMSLSSEDKVAQVIMNPGSYICRLDIMEGTLISNWFGNPKMWKEDAVKPGNIDWGKDPIYYANRLVHHIAPDKAWKDAVQTSLDTIVSIRERAPEAELNVISNLQLSLDLAVQIPISLGSDDNVSACVVLL
jgi:hypothetical protein